MKPRSFLVEIGTEELPPKALATLAEAFADEIASGFAAAGITSDAVEPLFSPRRLAVIASNVPVRQPDTSQQRLGPAVKAAFDAKGAPTRAAIGFAESCGIAPGDLERVVDGKNERVAATVTTKGQATEDLIPAIVKTALDRLPVPKRMRWGSGDASFSRPVRWVVMLFGSKVIRTDILGVPAGASTSGHRFHRPRRLRITSAQQYRALLEAKGRVRLNDRDRSLTQWVRKQVEKEAAALGGKALGLDSGLPDEVASLNEWPVPVVGGFDEKYLTLPPEVLTTTLEHHQRYFPVVGKDGGMLPWFITFANIESKDPMVVRTGNERVVVPRLEDAMFFWAQDQQRKLVERADDLAAVSFQAGLGTLADKAQRVAALSDAIADALALDNNTRKHANRAAALAKCDLLTSMVGEFPELQGTMGRYYALHDGEDAVVANAIGEHYLPRFAGDALPASPAGRVVALADRLDTLCGTFAASGKPTGDKDPFALRRTALGIMRILVEAELPLDLQQLVELAVSRLPSSLQRDGLANEIFDFSMDRLRAWLGEAGVPQDSFEAVLAVRPTQPLDFVARVHAVQAFRSLPESEALAAANKRIGNLLKQADTGGGMVDDTLLTNPAEQALWSQLVAYSARCKPLLANGHYTEFLTLLAELRGTVDEFFEAVMVMDKDPMVRANRIALLARLQALFHKVAAIGLLQQRADS